MITCKKAGPLIEKEEFEKLSLMKKIGLKLHLAWCKLCKGYKKDSTHLNELIKVGDTSQSTMKLSQAEKSEIKEKLVQ